MNDAAEILVIINSVFLILFLLLSIVLLSQAIIIARRIKRLVAKAENVADTLEAVGQAAKQAVTPVSYANILKQAVQSIKKQADRQRKGK